MTTEQGGFSESEDLRLCLQILVRDGSETDTHRNLARRALDRIRELETGLQKRADMRIECADYRRTLAQVNILLSQFMKSEAPFDRQLVDDARDLIHGALK